MSRARFRISSHRRWRWRFVLLVPVALYAVIAERNSWRPKKITLLSSTSLTQSIFFSPDGHILAVVDSPDNYHSSVVLCDVNSRREIRFIKSAHTPLFLGHGEYLCYSQQQPEYAEQRVAIIYLPTGKTVATGPKFFKPIGVLSDGETMIGWMYWRGKPGDDRKFFQWNWRSKRAPDFCFAVHTTPPNIEFETFWRMVDSTAMRNYYGDVVDVATGKLRFAIKERPFDYVSDFSSTPDGLLGRYNNNRVEVWDCRKGRLQHSFTTVSKSGFTICALSPNSDLIAGVGGVDQDLSLWNTKSGKLSRTLKSDFRNSTCMAFSPDGRTVATGKNDGTVQLWRIK